MSNVFLMILSGIAIPVLLFLFFWYLIRYLRYKYIGNLYIPIIIIAVICYFYSLYLRLNPIDTGSTEIASQKEHIAASIFGSFFDAVKMFALAFDTSKIAPFFNFSKELGNQVFYNLLFVIGYLFASIMALLSVSVLVVLTFFRNFLIRVKTLGRTAHRKKKIFYIFSDPKVTIAARLADAVTRDGDIAIFYLSRASQKTQEGSEYREMLISKGFDVRVEAYGLGLARWLFNKHFRKPYNIFARIFRLRTREVHVFGLFSEDDVANELGENFKDAVLANKKFVRAKRKIVFETKYADKKELENDIKEIKSYLDEDKFSTEKGIKDFAKLAEKLSTILGIKKVAKFDSRELKKIAKKERIHDGNFGLFCAKLGKNAVEVVKPNTRKLNGWIKKLEKMSKQKPIREHKLKAIENFRVFLTYHEGDMDLSHNNSSTTLHIVNTLSEYDMISTEFILNNQLNNFLSFSPNQKVDKKDNKHLHVTFLGFGKINRPIFEKMTFAYQYWGDNKNKVHYHILDTAANSFLEIVNNDYTKRKAKYDTLSIPLLYEITAEEDGKDLTSYEVIDNHIKNVFKDKNRFKDDGFEIFVVSVSNSAKSIQVANCLRKAILKYHDKNKGCSLLRTVIFVKISNLAMVDGFYGNKKYVKNQEYLNSGKLLESNRSEEELAPIVIFGQNTFMSKYVDDYYKLIDVVGKSSQKAYNKNNVELIRKKWLLNKKDEVLSNTTTVYSLKPKLELIGYELKQNPKTGNYYIEASSNAKSIDNIDYNDNVIKLIAEIEHNRWMASEYLIHQYGQWPIETFLDTIEMDGNKLDYRTKDREKTKHVCMLSKAGLNELYDRMANYKDDKKVLDQVQLEQEAFKLTVSNDIDALKDVLKDLKQSNNR